MSEAPPPPSPPTTASASDPSSTAVPPYLPLTLLRSPPYGESRSPLDSSQSSAAPAGSRKGKAVVSAAGAGARHDLLVDALRVVGRRADAGVAGADILELAMAKGPMFSWLSYWPEDGFPKEDHPY